MLFEKFNGIDNTHGFSAKAKVGTVSLALAGIVLSTPVAFADFYTVGTEDQLLDAITDAASEASPTELSLSSDITTRSGTVFDSAVDPTTLQIYTDGHTLTLDGAGTVWDAGSYNYVGIDGSTGGGLTLSNGAELRIQDGGSVAFLDLRAGALNIVDGASLETNYFAMGRDDDTTLTLANGGRLTSRNTTIGEDANNTNASDIVVTVDGAGTVWDAGYFAAGGATNAVAVTVSDGGAILTQASTIGRNGTGSLHVTGAGSRFESAGNLHIGERSAWINTPGIANGTLTISDGGFVSADAVIMAVDGAGTDASNSGVLDVNTGGILETVELRPHLGDATVTFDNGTLRARGNSGTDYSLISGFADNAFTIGAGGMYLDSNGFDVRAASGMSGVGALTKQGAGTLTLTGANTYGGATHVTAGTLAAGATNTFSAASAHHVMVGTLLDLRGFDQTIASLDNAGTVNLGGAPGTNLTVTGDYNGTGGVIFLNTALGDDNSATDHVHIGGDATGTGSIRVTNVGGAGAQTSEGIRIIEIMGNSDADFSLLGDYVFEGDQAVVGGAYAYRLYQGSISNPGDGDWYLRSALIPTDPGPDPDPIYQPGVPIYESYPQLLAAYNQPGTLQQRVGNRSWSGSGDTTNVLDPGNGQFGVGGVWSRIEAAHARDELDTTSGSTRYDSSLWRLQAGIDGALHQSRQGILVGGAYLDYGTIRADVASRFGDGQISTSGYGLGGTLTWYDTSGFYLDGVAQLRWFDSTLSSSTAGLNLVDGNHGFGYALSVEAGRKIGLDDRWSVTPQAQLTYNRVDFDDFTDGFGSPVGLIDGVAFRGRLGLSVNYEDTSQSDTRTHLYGIANLYYDFDDTTRIAVDDVELTASGDRLFAGLGAGGSYNWGADRYSLYGEASVRTSLNSLGTSYSLNGNVGIRVNW